MRKKYTVDEIVDNKYAVLLKRGDERKKLDIPLSEFPVKVNEGDILELDIEDGKIVFAEVDRKETERQRGKTRKLIEKLKDRSSKDLRF